MDVYGSIKSRTLNTTTGAATDKVVVADTNGVLKSVDRSGFASPYTAGAGITISSNTVSATGLQRVTENGKSGYRLIGIASMNQIGSGAVDLSSTFNNSLGASGVSAFATGAATQASGSWSTAMGGGTYAESQFETALGGNPTRDASPEPTGFQNYSKRLFTLGNSFNSTSKSDAFTILRNAKVGVDILNFETTTSDAKLQVNGAIKIGTNGTTAVNGVYNTTPMPCTQANEGSIQYITIDANNSTFQGCKKNKRLLCLGKHYTINSFHVKNQKTREFRGFFYFPP